MPLKKLTFRPGVNREITRYTNEMGWYDCDKVRFRQGLPERIGGWTRFSSGTFKGICRALFVWNSNGSAEYIGVGTNLKYYVVFGGVYFDITPIRRTTSAGAVTFSATPGSAVLMVADTGHGAKANDFVTFSGAAGLGGNVTADVLNAEHQIVSIVDANTYTIALSVTANSSDTGNGGVSVVGEYQENTGPEINIPISGWGAGPWGAGPWGTGEASNERLRLWTQDNFGENLVLNPFGGALYYWRPSSGVTSRAVRVDSLPGASDVPQIANLTVVSDVYRFVFCFGTNDIGSSEMDAMLIRWSDIEDITNWTPAATNQAGSLRLSRGSEIVAAIQARQEVLVWTDNALFSLQYLGAPAVWGAQLLGANTTIAGPNAVAYANGVAFWMGKDMFYQYDGRLTPLKSSLLKHVFNDINRQQLRQVFAGTLEEFNEVWWFYCSEGSTTVDKYVAFNYVDGVWTYGTMARTAWHDSSVLNYPLAATYSHNIVEHENGVDDNETGTPKPITAYIQSGSFSLDDGDRAMYVWRVLPDVGFQGSTAENPAVRMSFYPRPNAGGARFNPASVGGESSGSVVLGTSVPVEEFTEQLNIRVRGRNMAIRIESNDLGVTWQLGIPRIDMRPDGRRG